MTGARSPLVSPDAAARRIASAGLSPDSPDHETLALLRRAGASDDLATVERTPALSADDAAALVDLRGFAWELLASNPTTPALVLEKIARFCADAPRASDRSLLRQIAANPASNLAALLCAAVAAPSEVQQSPTFQLEVLAQGLDYLAYDRLCFAGMLALAGGRDTPPGLLLGLVEAERKHGASRHAALAAVVARRADLAPSIEEALVALEDARVASLLLDNPASSAAVAERVAAHEARPMRLLAASKGRLSRETFLRLLLSADREVRVTALSSVHLPEDLRSLFEATGAFDKPPAALSIEQQQFFLGAGSIARDLLLFNPWLAPATLERLALDGDRRPRALQLLAASPEVSPRRLVDLLCSSKNAVRLAALANPACPAAVVELLLRCGASPSLAALQPHERPLSSLSARDAGRLLRLGPFALLLLARHPCASPRVLAEVALRDRSSSLIGVALASHPQTPPGVLEALARSHPSQRVRIAASRRGFVVNQG